MDIILVKRPTISDLAEASGVSVATVDRVLNGRLPVREDTARRVQLAAGAIGFHAAGVIEQRTRRKVARYRLGFLLLDRSSHYYREFTHHLEAAAAASTQARVVCAFDYWDGPAPERVLDRMDALAATCHAIAVISHDHPSVSTAVARYRERGVPVFSLLSDFALGARDGYVGLDNRKVGRTAAWMIARDAPRPGKVALFLGSHSFHGHELREAGMRSYFREHAPGFAMLETRVVLETPDLAQAATREILAEHPDLSGLFVAGNGSEGAIAALREVGPTPRPAVVCSEITPETRAALADGVITMVVATPLARLCPQLIGMMAGALEAGRSGEAQQVLLPFDIHLPENI